MKNKRKIMFVVLLLFALGIVYFLNHMHLIPTKKYYNADFNIDNIYSKTDKDSDGVDDQNDILISAKKYVSTKPHYKSKYYQNGFPDDKYGVCTDVVAFAFLDAGYNLMVMVNKDILNNSNNYNIDTVDKNIDFRRVRNLKVFFDNNATILTNDIKDISQWQGGDIVIFPEHIAIVSDIRNKKGICYIIHNAGQIKYEEDSLARYEIVGHYRWIK